MSLDWPLNKPLYPSFGRVAFKHEFINRPKKGVEGVRCVNDDWVGFNTQGGSQWDGFRHFGIHIPYPFSRSLVFAEIM